MFRCYVCENNTTIIKHGQCTKCKIIEPNVKCANWVGTYNYWFFDNSKSKRKIHTLFECYAENEKQAWHWFNQWNNSQPVPFKTVKIGKAEI